MPAAVPGAAATPATPAGPRVAGRVVDDATGAPIAGATVVAGSVLVADATAPPAAPPGDALATTAGDGTFALPLGAPAFVAVFAPGYAALHAQPPAALGELRLVAPSADDLAELNDSVIGINALRARAGVAPVAFESSALAAARAWVAWEAATGLDGEIDRSQPPGSPNASIFAEYVARGGLVAPSAPSAMLANLTASTTGGPGLDAMRNIVAEGPNGPHARIVVDPAVRWVGVARANCAGPPSTPCRAGLETLVQLFVVPPPGVARDGVTGTARSRT